MKKLLSKAKDILTDERGFLGMLALGAAMLGASMYSAHKQDKAQKRAMKQLEEEQAKNEVKPTIVDDSRQQEERRRRNQLKQGSASTVLAGDYRQSAAKRLLGE